MMRVKDLTGQTFGALTAISRAENIDNHASWYCECSCGGNAIVSGRKLRGGTATTCGCVARVAHNFIDITGNTYGRLTVVSHAENRNKKIAMWNCVCECGAETTVGGQSLRDGRSQSCGCLNREILVRIKTKHGMCKTKTHSIWVGMRKRCNYTKGENYSYYGGRGISICSRWDKFNNFLSDMGECPADDYTLDREDNNGDYTPENCRWASRLTQANNMRSNRAITFMGKTMNVSEWARFVNIKYSVLSARINRYGWSIERAMTQIPRKSRRG